MDMESHLTVHKPNLWESCGMNQHPQVIIEMINRDKNHPSVLMWSLANEPSADLDQAADYFSVLVNFTRPNALGRPAKDKCVRFFDVICINRYFGWSDNLGRWDQVVKVSILINQYYSVNMVQKHPNTGYLIGELLWNICDFATRQSVKRIGALNNKGLFTRQRQPKAAAFIIKKRYEQLELISI